MIRLLFLLLLISPVGLAQKNTLLYRVHKKGYQDSYVFGTTHLIADSVFYFSDKLEKVIAACEAVVLEVDDITDQEKAKTLMQLQNGSSFDIFTPEQKDSVIRWGAEILHMSDEAFEKGFSAKNPFMLLQVGMQSMLSTPVRSYELEIMGRAFKNNLPVFGLETLEFQLAVFNALPDSVMAGMIMEQIRHPQENAAEEKQLTDLYVARNTEGLANFITERQKDSGLSEKLIYQRNRNWIPKMEEYMKGRKCFFAVGAGHLGGEKGVLQLLKDEGFEVTPVNY